MPSNTLTRDYVVDATTADTVINTLRDFVDATSNNSYSEAFTLATTIHELLATTAAADPLTILQDVLRDRITNGPDLVPDDIIESAYLAAQRIIDNVLTQTR